MCFPLDITPGIPSKIPLQIPSGILWELFQGFLQQCSLRFFRDFFKRLFGILSSIYQTNFPFEKISKKIYRVCWEGSQI